MSSIDLAILTRENQILLDIGRLIGALEYSNLSVLIEELDNDYLGIESRFSRYGFTDSKSRNDIFDDIKKRIESGKLSLFRIIAPFGFGKTAMLEEIKRRFLSKEYLFQNKQIIPVFLALNNIHTRTEFISEILYQLSSFDYNVTFEAFMSAIKTSSDRKEILEKALTNKNLLDHLDYREIDNFFSKIENKVIIKGISLIIKSIEESRNVAIIFLIDEFEAVSRIESFQPAYLVLLSSILRRCVYRKEKDDKYWKSIVTDTKNIRYDQDGTPQQPYDVLVYLLNEGQKSGLLGIDISELDVADRLNQPDISFDVKLDATEAINFAKKILKFYISNVLDIENHLKWKNKLVENPFYPLDESIFNLFGQCLEQLPNSKHIFSFRSLLIMISDTIRYFAWQNTKFLEEIYTPINPSYFWKKNTEILNLKDGHITSDFKGIRPIIQKKEIVSFVMERINAKSIKQPIRSFIKESISLGIINFTKENLAQVKFSDLLNEINIKYNSTERKEKAIEIARILEGKQFISFSDNCFYIDIDEIEKEFIIMRTESDSVTNIIKELLLTELNGKKAVSLTFFEMLKELDIYKDRNEILSISSKRAWNPEIFIFENDEILNIVKENVNKSGFGLGISVKRIWEENWPQTNDIIMPENLEFLADEVVVFIKKEFKKESISAEKTQKQIAIIKELEPLMDFFMKSDDYKELLIKDLSIENYMQLLVFYSIPQLISKKVDSKKEIHFDFTINNLWTTVIESLVKIPRKYEENYLEQKIGIGSINKKFSMHLVKEIILQGKNTRIDTLSKETEHDFENKEELYNIFTKYYKLKRPWTEVVFQSDLDRLFEDIEISILIDRDGSFRDLTQLPLKIRQQILEISANLSVEQGLTPRDISQILFNQESFNELTEHTKSLIILFGTLCVNYGFATIIPDKEEILFYSLDKQYQVKENLVKDLFTLMKLYIINSFSQEKIKISDSIIKIFNLLEKDEILNTEKLTSIGKDINSKIQIQLEEQSPNIIISDTLAIIDLILSYTIIKSNQPLHNKFNILKDYFALISRLDTYSKTRNVIFILHLKDFLLNLKVILDYNSYALKINKFKKNLSTYTNQAELKVLKIENLEKELDTIPLDITDLRSTINEIDKELESYISKSIVENNIDISEIKRIFSKIIFKSEVPEWIIQVDFKEILDSLQIELNNYRLSKINDTEMLTSQINDYKLILKDKNLKDLNKITEKLSNYLHRLNSLNLENNLEKMDKEIDKLNKEYERNVIKFLKDSKISDTDLQILKSIDTHDSNLNNILLDLVNLNFRQLVDKCNISDKKKKLLLSLVDILKRNKLTLQLDYTKKKGK